VSIDLGRIRQDTYAVGCEKDHIVPWDSAWRISQLFGGAVRYVLASSGHVAGIINPPGGKGEYRTAPEGSPSATPQDWLKSAERHSGSWWPDWSAWLAARSGPLTAPPSLGSTRHPPLEDAPGSYVLQT
jgi:polyhydroxyalkanoate synthase